VSHAWALLCVFAGGVLVGVLSWARWTRSRRLPPRHPIPGWPAGAAFPDDLAEDLRRHLHEALYAVDARGRRSSHWVMSAEWWNEVRKLNHPGVWPSRYPGEPRLLLSLPVEVRDGGGVPHLEPDGPPAT
jgi:hypothetical protein